MKKCKHCGSTTRFVAVWMNEDTGEVLRDEHGPAFYNGEDYMCGGCEPGPDDYPHYSAEDFEPVWGYGVGLDGIARLLSKDPRITQAYPSCAGAGNFVVFGTLLYKGESLSIAAGFRDDCSPYAVSDGVTDLEISIDVTCPETGAYYGGQSFDVPLLEENPSRCVDELVKEIENESTLIVGPVPTLIVDEWKATLLLDSQDWSGDASWEIAYDIVISHKLCPMEHGDIDTELAREWAKELLTMMGDLSK